MHLNTKAKSIETNQLGLHPDLVAVVARHKQNKSQKPIAAHTQSAFEHVENWLGNWQGSIIVDACCGVGESTLHIAAQYPDCKIIGIDKSAHRIGKHEHYQRVLSDVCESNQICVIQADLLDFWRLLEQKKQWNIVKQYLLYPNPYPKKSQLQKRWHAMSSFPSILSCCNNLELRSNWELYLLEFQAALKLYDVESEIEQVLTEPMTPFERKYIEAGQICWKLTTVPNNSE